MDNDYKIAAMIVSLERTLEDFKIPKKSLDVKDPRWLFEWALLESGIDAKSGIPDDKDKLYDIFKSVSETIPALNGGTKEFIENMMEAYEIFTKKYNPLIDLRKVDMRFGLEYDPAS